MGVEFSSQTAAQRDQVQRLIKIVFQNTDDVPVFRF